MWLMPPGTVPAILAVQVFLRGISFFSSMMMMMMKAVRVSDANMLGTDMPDALHSSNQSFLILEEARALLHIPFWIYGLTKAKYLSLIQLPSSVYATL
jgi:hypothetical protein